MWLQRAFALAAAERELLIQSATYSGGQRGD
jgi:hypothetical protein